MKKMRKATAFALVGTMALGTMGGNGIVSQAEENGDIVTLKWYQYVENVEPDTDMVIDALNEYLREKIGVEVDYTAIPFSDYSEKMPTLINAGEEFDICFTANWTTNYQQFANTGAFLDITDLLPEYASETWEFVPEELWEAASIDGRIYGVPNYKETGWQVGFMVNTGMAEEYGIDLTKIETMEDFGEALKVVEEKSQAEGKDILGTTGLTSKSGPFAYEALADALPGAYAVEGYGIFQDQEGVFNQYATQEYMDYCKMIREWYLNGYLGEDPVNYESDINNGINDFKEGKVFSRFVNYAPGMEASEESRTGFDCTYIPMMNPLIDTQGVLGGLLAVSSFSENPEKAVELINLINTDEYVGTMLRHGIEGVHYTAVGEDQIDSTMGGSITSDENGYDYGMGWVFGSVYNQKWDIAYPDDIEEQYMEFNDSAYVAPHLGFTLNTVPVETEVAALNGVIEEYAAALQTGMVDPEEYIPMFLEELEANGADILMEEISKQLSEFEQSNAE